MFAGDLAALAAGATTIIPGALIALGNWFPGRLRTLGLAVAAFGAGKFFRVRSVFDVHVEPFLAHTLGIHNLPVAIGVVLGLCAFALVVASLQQSPIQRGVTGSVTAVISLAFLALFAFGYGSRFLPYLSADGLDSPTQAAAWAIPLFFQGATSIVVLVLAAKALRTTHDSRLGRITSYALLLMGIMGQLYFLSKLVYLVLSTLEVAEHLLPLLSTLSFLSLPASIICLAAAVYVPTALHLGSRTRRYFALRAELVTTSPRKLWHLSADPEETHRAIIDHADSVILDGPQNTAT